jgi:hypothetical protein
MHKDSLFGKLIAGSTPHIWGKVLDSAGVRNPTPLGQKLLGVKFKSIRRRNSTLQVLPAEGFPHTLRVVTTRVFE